MTSISQDRRLLSHRLRGFDDRESTTAGMSRALDVGVCHVEFDLRITSDHELIAFHDPFIEIGPANWPFVDQLSLAELRASTAGCSVPTLAEMCQVFATHASSQALMHVDVKIGGQEARIREVLRVNGVLERTVLVSWMPSVLRTFHAMDPKLPLCFSHLTLARAPWLFPVAWYLSRSGLVDRMRGLCSGTASLKAHNMKAARLYVHENGNPNGAVNGDELLRSNPGHLVRDAVRGDLRKMLSTSRGYVCVPTMMATHALISEYERDGIGVAVFSAKSAGNVQPILEELHPSLVYVDDAAAFKS